MKTSTIFSSIKDFMFKQYATDGGKMLVHMGALGWVFSSIAQISMVYKDKNIDPKKKKFLNLQEFFDAGVNVTMYYTLCSVIKSGSDALIEKGFLAHGEVVDKLLTLKPASMNGITKKNWRSMFTSDELKKLSETLSNLTSANMFKNATPQQLAQIRIEAAPILEKFKSFKNGIGVSAAIIGSVIACNIVTPIVRNKLANVCQRVMSRIQAKEQRKEQIVNNIVLQKPLPVSFSAFRKYNSYGNMKI